MSRAPKSPQDSIDDVMGFAVIGIDLDAMKESARLQAARVWGVRAALITVQLQNVGIHSYDPFCTDLNTYAAVDKLRAYAKCVRIKDPNMPEHDTL
jgi:hypothetical protein